MSRRKNPWAKGPARNLAEAFEGTKRGDRLWFVRVNFKYAPPFRAEVRAKLARTAIARAIGQYQKASRRRLVDYELSVLVSTKKPAGWVPGQEEGWFKTF